MLKSKAMTPLNSPVVPPPAGRSSLHGELTALRIDRSKPRPRSAASILLWLLLAAGIVLGIGALGYTMFQDTLFPVPVVATDSVRVMTQGQVSTQLTATGYLESRLQAAVGAKVPGRIARIPVVEGSVVKEGDILAELEHADLDAGLLSRKVAVKLAEAQLSEAAFNLKQAERDWVREQDVYQRKAGTSSGLERAETTQLAAKAIYEARQAALEAAKSSVKEAEEAIRNMFIYAPFDGTVITKDAEQGESIMPGGMGVGSGRGSVITLANLNELEVDTDVKEDYLGQIRKGQPAQVVVDAVPDRRYQGRLREIIPMGDRTRGIVKVKVSILDADERLFPDLSATVNFLPDAAGTEEGANQAMKKGIFAPAEAIQKEGETQFVWVVAEDRVRRKNVKTTGETQEGLIEITEGLLGGERVVTQPPADLKDGDRVKLEE
jgi:RND family efflux transporter MFP subunit